MGTYRHMASPTSAPKNAPWTREAFVMLVLVASAIESPPETSNTTKTTRCFIDIVGIIKGIYKYSIYE